MSIAKKKVCLEHYSGTRLIILFFSLFLVSTEHRGIRSSVHLVLWNHMFCCCNYNCKRGFTTMLKPGEINRKCMVQTKKNIRRRRQLPGVELKLSFGMTTTNAGISSLVVWTPNMITRKLTVVKIKDTKTKWIAFRIILLKMMYIET